MERRLDCSNAIRLSLGLSGRVQKREWADLMDTNGQGVF